MKWLRSIPFILPIAGSCSQLPTDQSQPPTGPVARFALSHDAGMKEYVKLLVQADKRVKREAKRSKRRPRPAWSRLLGFDLDVYKNDLQHLAEVISHRGDEETLVDALKTIRSMPGDFDHLNVNETLNAIEILALYLERVPRIRMRSERIQPKWLAPSKRSVPNGKRSSHATRASQNSCRLFRFTSLGMTFIGLGIPGRRHFKVVQTGASPKHRSSILRPQRFSPNGP